uniref:Uncharacterized protein n=1 Tax=Setaria italica TaxID=4555 RepID=K3YIR0_SETIT
MAAEVGEHLPALDDLVEEVVELDDEALGSRSQHPNPAIDDLGSLGDLVVVAVAPHANDPVQKSCLRLSMAARAWRNSYIMMPAVDVEWWSPTTRCNQGWSPISWATRCRRRAMEATSGSRRSEEEGGGVAEGVEDSAEPVEGVELEVPWGAGVEEEGGRVEPCVGEGAVVLLESGGVSPGCVDGAHEVVVVVVVVVVRCGGGGVERQPVVDGRGDAGGGGAVCVERGGAGTGELAGVPEAGGLVHVLVQPPLAGREVEALHHVEKLGVEGAEEGGGLLEEGSREARVRAAVEGVEAVRHRRVEPAVRHCC